jgi:arylsulfatase A
VPLLRGKKLSRERPLFWHYANAIGEPKVALRDGDWILLAEVDAPPTPPGSGFVPARMPHILKAKPIRFELYNVRDDIAQAKERSAEEPERLERMSSQMRRILASVQSDAPDWRKN